MDSMRSLNTSLPSTTSPRRHASHPPEQLLSAFKQAALSVTHLFKSAAAEQAQASQDGYQDALDELLSFMDRENIGLQDGEGWRVRQWATERYQPAAASTAAASESDEEVEESDKARPRSSSPRVQRQTSKDTLQLPATSISSTRAESAPPVSSSPPEPAPREPLASVQLPQSDFSFRVGQYPPPVHDIEMVQSDDHQVPNNNTNNAPNIQVNIQLPRQSRNSRHSGNRTNNRLSNTVQLGPGAGLKRRITDKDFFDLGNLYGKDDRFGGGGKRGRFS